MVFFAGFGCINEESVDSRGNDLSEAFREQGVFEPFGSSSLSRSFLFGGAFEDGAPCAAWGYFSKRLSANAGSLHHGLPLPGWFSGMARFDMEPFSLRAFCGFSHSAFQEQVILAVLIMQLLR